jgi:transketolase C-terminal domain/subunit
MVMGWSISTMLVEFAKEYTTVLWLRYLLGVWEAENFIYTGHVNDLLAHYKMTSNDVVKKVLELLK